MAFIRYTRHARNRMRWHRITEDEVESAINAPDFTEPSLEGRINTWKIISDRYLKVTIKQGIPVLVITAVKKKKDWR